MAIGSMGVKVQARLESALEAPATVAPAKRASVDRETVWDRMDAHGVSQNEVRPAGRRLRRLSLGDHGGEGHPVSSGAAAAARRPLPAVAAG